MVLSKQRRWLVTGGCGFIGTNLLDRLLQEGACIRVFDDLSVGTRDALAAIAPFVEKGGGREWRDRLQLVVGDIRDADSIRSAAEGADVIVHLAASTGVPQSVADPRFDCVSNVVGTLNVLEAARHHGVRRFIFASSGAPAGEVEPPIHEEIVPKPVSPYGASKLAGEAYCSAYARTFGIETVALRFGNVYGPGSGHKSSVVAKWIGRAVNGRSIEIFGDGSASRDFVFVSDLVDAVLRAAEADAATVAGEVYQIATSRETSIGEIAEVLVESLADAGLTRPSILHEPPRPGDVKRNYADTTKARRDLGWIAETGLKEGLRRTVADLAARPDRVPSV